MKFHRSSEDAIISQGGSTGFFQVLDPKSRKDLLITQEHAQAASSKGF